MTCRSLAHLIAGCASLLSHIFARPDSTRVHPCQMGFCCLPVHPFSASRSMALQQLDPLCYHDPHAVVRGRRPHGPNSHKDVDNSTVTTVRHHVSDSPSRIRKPDAPPGCEMLLSLLKNARNVMTHIKPIGQANVSSVVFVDVSRMLTLSHKASVQRRVQYGCS